MSGRKRILFIAEAVTLAHVARPLALAAALDVSRFDVVFACDPRFRSLFPPSLLAGIRDIRSISSQQFLEALARGKPVYDVTTLEEYVREDLSVLADVRPDVVVGDFRLSLSVSARLAGVPYVALANAYWSPYSREHFPCPELPVTRILGERLGSVIFALARPFAFALHTLPLNRVRRRHGLPALGFDLRRVYTDADFTLYADVAEMLPCYDLPPTHRYLGPILWSPEVPLPDWWSTIPADRLCVYVTLGSSGHRRLLPLVLDALAPLPISVIAATAGSECPRPPSNAHLATYLPGVAAAERADVVICNGGSLTSQQALAAGVPVLGIASNLDQFLNMEAVRRAGAGITLRADSATPATIRARLQELLDDTSYRTAAGRLAQLFARRSAAEAFAGVIEHLCGGGSLPADGQSAKVPQTTA